MSCSVFKNPEHRCRLMQLEPAALDGEIKPGVIFGPLRGLIVSPWPENFIDQTTDVPRKRFIAAELGAA